MSTDRPHVLVLASTYPRWTGDTEPSFVHQLCRELAASMRVTVIAPHALGTERAETLDGVRVERFRYAPTRFETLAYNGGIPARLRSNPLAWLLVAPFLLGMIWNCWRELRRNDYDVIHAHWLLPQGLVALVARWLSGRRIPVLCTSHGADLFSFSGLISDRLKRFVIRGSSAVTVVSEAMRRRVIALQPDAQCKTCVLPMGVDLKTTFTPHAHSPRAANRLLFVGRLVEKKGAGFLLQAVRELMRREINVDLRIIGDGPLRVELERAARRLMLGERVTFHGAGSQDAVVREMQAATVLVMPYIEARDGDQEGFGLVQVEAMGCECPVISSDLAAIRDVVTDGVTGLLVPPGDVNALADAIQQVLQEPALGRQLAFRAREEAVRRFDWNFIGAKYTQLLVDLARNSTSSNKSR